MTFLFCSLHLELYRSLGVEWLHPVDAAVASDVKKCRIRSAVNNDVHVVEISSEQPVFDVCNKLWNHCSY